MGFPDGSAGKESGCNAGDAGDLGLNPGSGSSPGEGNDNPLQYSFLENLMDRGGLVGNSPWGHKELDTTKRLNLHLRKKNSTCSLSPAGSVEAASAFKALKKGRVENSLFLLLLDTPPQPPNTTFAGSANYASLHDISCRCVMRKRC